MEKRTVLFVLTLIMTVGYCPQQVMAGMIVGQMYDIMKKARESAEMFSTVTQNKDLSALQEQLFADAQFQTEDELFNTYIMTEKMVADGLTNNSILDLYYFYENYLKLIRRLGETANIKKIVQNYVTASEKEYIDKDIVKMNAEDVAYITFMDTYYTNMMSYTKDCDEILIGGLTHLAEFFESYGESPSAINDMGYELNSILHEQSAVTIRFKIFLLQKNTQMALEHIFDYINDSQYGSELSLFFGSDIMLFQEDPESAVEYADAYFEIMKEEQGYKQDHFDYVISNYMNWLYVCKTRGLLKQADILAFTDNLSVQPAVTVYSVGDKGKKSGFLEGDKIVSINGEKIFSNEQFLGAVVDAQGDVVQVDVLRENTTKTLTADKKGNLLGIAISITTKQNN